MAYEIKRNTGVWKDVLSELLKKKNQSEEISYCLLSPYSKTAIQLVLFNNFI